MSLTTLNYLYARAPISTLSFSGVTTTASIYLKGGGGEAGDGFPMPRDGVLTGLRVWDGTTLRFDTDEISFAAGDRLAVYCQTTGSNLSVKIRVNGTSTAMQVTGVPFNSTLFAVIEFVLIHN